jgi:hypothetical protein
VVFSKVFFRRRILFFFEPKIVFARFGFWRKRIKLRKRKNFFLSFQSDLNLKFKKLVNNFFQIISFSSFFSTSNKIQPQLSPSHQAYPGKHTVANAFHVLHVLHTSLFSFNCIDPASDPASDPATYSS